ncbi:magnesium transporter MRS2-F-like isoform X3 [Camellia sinensis]|uniref:magnesium transporter MRS2-F-like isoform X3 n=1 Tax=Camellia sinensis TaxID=4442 RepID=UPI001036DC62|nr:magnesium transporter MRS2-F-like isoform X3 [Camellia sinensis]
MITTMEDSNKEITSTTLARRPKGVVTKQWLVVPQVGKSRIEEVGKHSIMRRTGIPARDLRILDPTLSYPSTILGRERAIVVNLEHIKAIITANEMLVLNPKDPGVAPFVQDLELKLCNVNTGIDGSEKTIEDTPLPSKVGVPQEASGDNSPKISFNTSSKVGSSKVPPFEFRVLEICLKFVCRCLESELRDELEHLLDDDMDMAEMYLTAKLFSPQFEDSESKQNNIDDDDTVVLEDYSDEEEIRSNKSSSGGGSGQKPKIYELEKLLEVYFVQLDGALNKLSTMREYVDDTEDYINIILDDKQNQLLRVGVVISIALVIINFCIVTAGVLGMNIRIPLFDFGVPLQFDECFVALVGTFFVLFAITLFTIKKKGLLG